MNFEAARSPGPHEASSNSDTVSNNGGDERKGPTPKPNENYENRSHSSQSMGIFAEGGDRHEEETFPQQLMYIIEEETTKGTTFDANGQRVLEWNPAGDAFVIRDRTLVESEILPRHFSLKCKFMSFVRKLYRWGFRQLNKEAPLMTFGHPNFVRGDKKRCLRMRSLVRKQASSQKHSADAENKISTVSDIARMDPTLQLPSWRDYPQMPPALDLDLGRSSSLFASSGQYARGRDTMLEEFNRSSMASGLPPFSDGLFSQGYGSGRRITSRDLFEAGIRLQRLEEMEQRQEQPRASMSNNGDFSRALGAGPDSMLGREKNHEIDLATQLMKADPDLEPWKALQMAKCLKKG